MGNQFGDFKNRFNNLGEEIKVLQRVNLITPSITHINAFMYEPIVDMGFDDLKELYQQVRDELG